MSGGFTAPGLSGGMQQFHPNQNCGQPHRNYGSELVHSVLGTGSYAGGYVDDPRYAVFARATTQLGRQPLLGVYEDARRLVNEAHAEKAQWMIKPPLDAHGVSYMYAQTPLAAYFKHS